MSADDSMPVSRIESWRGFGKNPVSDGLGRRRERQQQQRRQASRPPYKDPKTYTPKGVETDHDEGQGHLDAKA